LNPEEWDSMRNIPYAQAIGHVLWPVMISWPDAVFQVVTTRLVVGVVWIMEQDWLTWVSEDKKGWGETIVWRFSQSLSTMIKLGSMSSTISSLGDSDW
jgi:hypothetical protein